MFKAFLDTQSSSDGVLERVKTEAERGIVVEDFIEELSALFDFKVISAVHSTFVDCATSVHFLGFTLST